YQTADATAHANVNYASAAGTLTFQPGQTTQQIPVPIFGDSVLAPTLTFQFVLANPVNTTVDDGTGIGSILNVDSPQVFVASASGFEGDSGSAGILFTASIQAAQRLPVSFSVSTADDPNAIFPA